MPEDSHQTGDLRSREKAPVLAYALPVHKAGFLRPFLILVTGAVFVVSWFLLIDGAHHEIRYLGIKMGLKQLPLALELLFGNSESYLIWCGGAFIGLTTIGLAILEYLSVRVNIVALALAGILLLMFLAFLIQWEFWYALNTQTIHLSAE